MQNIRELRINGARHNIDLKAGRTLLNVLREDLDLTGTKYGCGEGQCGACTVLIDGRSVKSCLTQAATVVGKQITTIEGLQQPHPLQKSFVECGAMQCGYCIPGMIMSAAGLLKNNPNPSDQQILRAMEGNICRCGSHPRILEAIKKVAGTDIAKDREGK